MPEYLIKIPEEKNENFLKAVSKMTYVTIKETKKNISKEKKFTVGQLQFAKQLYNSLKEVELAEQGKIKLKSARELMNEL
jgi:hypothetical protein